MVLIDTAGRMQDNEPLMKALSRLIVLNQPDLVVFIGEALTGNDASDQLMKFNKAIVDLSPKDNIREIDAIILSKFDTVDEKGYLFFSVFELIFVFKNSWNCDFSDLCHWKTDFVLRSWSEIHSLEKIECENSGSRFVELNNFNFQRISRKKTNLHS